MRIQRASARLTAIAATAGLTAGLALVGPAAQAATPQAKASTTWLSSQLSSGLVKSEYQDGAGAWQAYTDYGLTLDFFYAFEQVGVRAAQREAILDAIEPQADWYTGSGTTEYAGALGKLLTAVQNEGLDPATYATGDLLARLEARVQDTGPEEGRGKDAFDETDPYAGDWSNTFGQAYVATALAAAGSSEADEAISFLLDQQCAAGFFRESMSSADFTCDGGTTDESKPDVDATASAALALRELLPAAPASVEEPARLAIRKAVRWLGGVQRDSGAFVGNGRPNSNSTGLAAVALAEAGRDAAATKAARWVNTLRVTPTLARRTALKAGDVGAIAYDGAALKLAKSKGITRGVRYTWRRSTAQAAPALDVL